MTEVVVINQSGESPGSAEAGGGLTIHLGGGKIFSHLVLSGAEPDVLADFKRVMSDLDRLRALEVSVRRKAEMIKGHWRDASDESCVGGELHVAITDLLLELESESEARQVASIADCALTWPPGGILDKKSQTEILVDLRLARLESALQLPPLG